MAKKKNKMFEKVFYEKSREYGWSRNVLTRPGDWYTKLLEDGSFSPRSVRHDGHEVWYKIHTWKFQEERFPVTKIEDIMEVPDENPYDGKATGIVNLNVFCLECECSNIIFIWFAVATVKKLFSNLEKNKKKFEKRYQLNKEEFFKKKFSESKRDRNRRQRKRNHPSSAEVCILCDFNLFIAINVRLTYSHPCFHLFCSPRLVRPLQRKSVLPRFENCPSRMFILLL